MTWSRKKQISLKFSASLLSVLLMAGMNAPAANSSWVGAGATPFWNLSDNWLTGVPGGVGTLTNADTATFDIAEGGLIAIDSGRNIKSVIFGPSAGSFVLGAGGANAGQSLHLSHGGELGMALGSTVTQVIHAPLVLEAESPTSAGSYTFANRTFVHDISNSTPTTTGATPKLNIAGDISAGTTTGSYTLTLAGTVGTRNAGNASQAMDQANTISGIISDGGAAGGLKIVVNGTAGQSFRYNAWNLTGLNTFSGEVHVQAGALYFNSIGNVGEASALGTGTKGDIRVQSFLMYTGAAAETNRKIIGAGGSFHNHGTGALTLNGSVETTGGIIFRGSQNFIINGLVSGGGAFGNNGGLKTTLNNNSNSFTGTVTIYDGTITVGTLANTGQDSALGRGGTVVFGQNSTHTGTLEYTGGTTSTNKNFQFQNGNVANSGNGRILHNGSGKLTLTGTFRATNADSSFDSKLELTGTGHGVITGVIGGTTTTPGTATATRLVKSGASTWELQGANNYYGDTTISGGTLLLNHATQSSTGTSSVYTSGSGVLGGTGIASGRSGGSITIAANTGLMVGNTHGVAKGTNDSLGYTSQASTLTLGSNTNVALTLAGNLRFDLFSNQSGITSAEADRLILKTTSSVNLGGVIRVTNVSGETGWRSGEWQLIDWSGTSSAIKSNAFTYDLDTTGLATGYGWNTSTFLDDGIISISPVAYIWRGAGGTNAWNDAANWDSNGSPPEGSASMNSSVKDVVFEHVATGNHTSGSWSGDMRVVNIYFTDPDTKHRIGSGGTLYTFGKLLRVDGGEQEIDATLRFRGTEPVFTIQNEGKLTLERGFMFGQADAGGSTTRTLVFSGSGETFTANIQLRRENETLHVQQNGTGVTTILAPYGTPEPASNTPGRYIGKTSILKGTLRINNEDSLGRTYETLVADHLTINGGTLGAFGTFTMNDATRGITIGSNGGTVEVEGTHTLSISNPISGSGAFTKAGTGTLSLSADQTSWSSTITVTHGTLNINNPTGSATGTGSVAVQSGATLSGGGSISGGPSTSITLGTGSHLIVGNTHGVATTKQDLVLGNSTSPTLVDITLKGSLKFDLLGPGLTAALGDSVYNSLDTINNDLLEIQTLGDIDLSGATIELAAIDTSGWELGQNWKIIDWSDTDYASLTTTGLNLSTTTLGSFSLSHIVMSDGLYITVVPEPQRLLLILGSMICLFLRRKRQDSL